MCVFAFVWLVDPLHVGPLAPGPLTHIIKSKGLPPSIRSHKDEGHIIICIICLTWPALTQPPPSLSRTSSSSVVVGFWKCECVLCLKDIVSCLTKSIWFTRLRAGCSSICVGFTCQNSRDPLYLSSIHTHRIHMPTATTYLYLFTQCSTIWIRLQLSLNEVVGCSV